MMIIEAIADILAFIGYIIFIGIALVYGVDLLRSWFKKATHRK